MTSFNKKPVIFLVGLLAIAALFTFGRMVLATTGAVLPEPAPPGNSGGTPSSPTPPAPTRQLTVTITSNGGSGTGTGSVIGKEQDGTVVVNCGTSGSRCSGGVGSGNVTVTLTATPASGYQLSKWGGDCSGTSNTGACSLSWVVDDVYNANVSADFTKIPPPQTPTYTLTFNVSNQTDQSFSFSSNAAGIDGLTCSGSTCSASATVDQGTSASISSADLSGLSANWSGCTPSGTSCSLTVNGDTTVGLTVSKKPVFGGTMLAEIVSASPADGLAMVRVTWPQAQNAPGVVYKLYLNGNYVKNVSAPVSPSAPVATYTSGPLGASSVWSVKAFDSQGNLINTLSSNVVNLNLKAALSGYAWANATATLTQSSFQKIGSATFYQGITAAVTPFTVTGNAGASSVTLSVSDASDAWKGTIYRCAAYDPTNLCVGQTQLGTFNLGPGQTYTFTDKNLSSATAYYYAVTGYGVSATWGVGQYFEARTGGGAYTGIGWVKFSDSSLNNLNNYGVYVDSNNNLVGYAWNGSGYGWLSFNVADFQGCPASGPGGPNRCAPSLDANGQLTGYARFLAFRGGNSSWDGWVDLSNLTYNSLANDITGITPAAPTDILGQMSFCDPNHTNDPANAAYCVTMGNISTATTTATSSPTITNLVAGTSSITVYWTNPVTYKHVQVQVSQPNQADFNNKNLYTTPLNKDFYDSVHVDATSTSVSTTIPGLYSSTTYGIFVRGFTQ